MTLPVALEDARRQLKMELDDESNDDELKQFIADAAAWVENYTGHILEARDVMEVFGGFGRLHLRAWPVASAAPAVISYGHPGETATIMTGARVSTATRPARVIPPVSLVWPTYVLGWSVSVTVRAGHETPDTVPRILRRAMLVLISGYDEGGADLVAAEATARKLCSSFRARAL